MLSAFYCYLSETLGIGYSTMLIYIITHVRNDATDTKPIEGVTDLQWGMILAVIFGVMMIG